MLTFKSYLMEREFYHTTRSQRDADHLHKHADRPIWLSHKKGDAIDHHKDAALDGSRNPQTHRMKVKGRVAHYANPKVRAKLIGAGHTDEHQKEYKHMLLKNPHGAHNIHDHPITKTLKKHGYVGYRHKEFNFRSDKPNTSTVVFHRKHVEKGDKLHSGNVRKSRAQLSSREPGASLDKRKPIERYRLYER